MEEMKLTKIRISEMRRTKEELEETRIVFVPVISLQCRILASTTRREEIPRQGKGKVCILFLPVFVDGVMTKRAISEITTIRAGLLLDSNLSYLRNFCVCEYDISSIRYILSFEYV